MQNSDGPVNSITNAKVELYEFVSSSSDKIAYKMVKDYLFLDLKQCPLHSILFKFT